MADAESHEDDRSPSQTPLFYSLNAERYRRQLQIKAIERITSRRLLCWVTDDHAQLDGNDIPPLADILHDLTGDEDVDLLIRSPGGVIDTAWDRGQSLRRSDGRGCPPPDLAVRARTRAIRRRRRARTRGRASIASPSGSWPFRSVLCGIAGKER